MQLNDFELTSEIAGKLRKCISKLDNKEVFLKEGVGDLNIK